MDFKALEKIQYGIYIASSAAEGRNSGCIVNAVFQITAEPVRFAVSVSKLNFTYELIEKSSKLAISALSQDAPLKFIGNFGFKSGRNFNKFENVEHSVNAAGIPLVTVYACACYELETELKIDMQTHMLFICKVADMRVINPDAKTMTYEYYHKIKGGLTAKNAPTYTK
jgi:flavin reductase (DIM6/NTAB) family NADH-FMN oxidoreductase RutF